MTSYLRLDVKIQQHTNNSIARKTPGIKALARRFNLLRNELATHRSRPRHSSIPLPPALDIAQLFNPDANPEMWNNVMANTEEGQDMPAYLVHPEVQQGILGWLTLQRCTEEEARLMAEISLLLQWISARIRQIHAALKLSTGKRSTLYIPNDWPLSTLPF